MSRATKEPGIFRRCGCTAVVKDGGGNPVLAANGRPKRRELGTACPELARNPKHGGWGFQVDVAAVPGSGKGRRRIRRTGFATKTEAKNERNGILAKGDKGANRRVANSAENLADYLDRWLNGRRKLRPATRESYQGHIANYLGPYLGTIRLRDLDAERIGNMFLALEARNDEIRKARETLPRRRRRAAIDERQDVQVQARPRVLGPASLQRIRATLRKALNDAIKAGVMQYPNPASLVELESGEAPPPQLWTVAVERRWRETGEIPVPTMVWRGDQCGLFLDAAKHSPYRDLFEFAAYTGARRGELCGLRWADVDLDQGELHIRVQLTVVAGKVLEGPTKSRAGQRTLPLTPDLHLLLNELHETQATALERWGPAWVDSGRVFTRQDGSQLDPNDVSDEFRRITASVDLPPVRLHAMRAAVGSMALAAGVQPKVVSTLLGHANERVTSRHYTVVADELKREAAVAIGALIPRRGTELAPIG